MQLAHHRHQARVRHAVRRGAAEQDGRAIGMLHFVGGQVQVQGAHLTAEARRNPARQQVDGTITP
jgi:hypothetical protein